MPPPVSASQLFPSPTFPARNHGNPPVVIQSKPSYIFDTLSHTLIRTALFTDSFHELNGVGTVTRELASYAKRNSLPFCCIHAGPKTRVTADGSVTTIELQRGPSFPLDHGLYCDPFLSRYRNEVIRHLQKFRPDVVHITGPGDMGVLGFWVAHCLGVPLAASWHTNLHEYAGRRTHKGLRFTPTKFRESVSASIQNQSLRALMAFYRLAHFVMAPNPDMQDLLLQRTGRPAFPLRHGVDASRFLPTTCRCHSEQFCIGWVGRLTSEKNVRAFVDLERQLLEAGETNFKLLLVGDGGERDFLQRNLKHATMPGFLEGKELSEAFGAMDAFVFPSLTDTFGLVILEAMASGVPVVLAPEAGKRVGVRDGVDGFLTLDPASAILKLMRSRQLAHAMGQSARSSALTYSWQSVFDGLYQTYDEALREPQVRARLKNPPVLGDRPALNGHWDSLNGALQDRVDEVGPNLNV